jgi:hypothetical protein
MELRRDGRGESVTKIYEDDWWKGLQWSRGTVAAVSRAGDDTLGLGELAAMEPQELTAVKR